MNITKKIIFIVLFFIVVGNAGAFKSNSSNFILFPTIVSGGGEIANSSNFKNYMATDIIAGVINSSNFRNLLGFFHTWLLADGQPCTANNQCQGGFCCSNACQSSSCPVDVTPSPGGGAAAAAGGGGGGALPIPEKDFSLSKNSVKAELILAEEKSEEIIISNTGKASLDFSISVDGEAREFISIEDDSFTLSAGDSKTIGLDFIGKRVGIYTGQVVVKGDGIEKNIAVSVEVESKISLFDVKLDIPAERKKVHPGGNLRTQITLLNVGAPELVDVIATYLIKDLRGNIVYQASETFAVENQKSFARDFPILKNLEPGSYVAIIELRYADSFAVSSEFFEVIEPGAEETKRIIRAKLTSILLAGILIAISSLSVLYIISRKLSKRRK